MGGPPRLLNPLTRKLMDAKEVFVAKHLDEMVGLLLGAFGQTVTTQHKMGDEHFAADGKFMIQQMKRAKDFLGRIWEAVQPPKPAPK